MQLTLREAIARDHRLPQSEEILMGRAELLAPEERDLIEAIMIREMSTRAVGRLKGVKAREVRNRVCRIARRLRSRQFLDAARAIPYLTPHDALLAKLRFCQAMSIRDISRELGIGYHVLRRQLDKVSGRIEVVKLLSRRGFVAGAGSGSAEKGERTRLG